MTGYRRVGVYMGLVTGVWGYICGWLPACGGYICDWLSACGGIYVTGYWCVGVYM